MSRNRTFISSVGILAAALFLLAACVTEDGAFVPPALPQGWQQALQPGMKTDKNPSVLDRWWTFMGDPVLNDLVDLALKDDPDAVLVLSRVREARAAQRSMMADIPEAEGFYEPGFDASYEAGMLGVAEEAPEAGKGEVSDGDARLTLIAEIVRSYAGYCLIRQQAKIAGERIKSGKRVLDLIREQKLYGAATDQDVAQAEKRVNEIRAEIPVFLRRSDNARLRIGLLTGALPEAVFNLVMNSDSVLEADVTPVLAAPAAMLTHRPDIRAAQERFVARTGYERAVTADLFPAVSLSDFYGIQDGAFADPSAGWSVAPGAAVPKVDFSRAEDRVDAGQAQEEQAYQDFRLAVLEAVMDVEGALVEYMRGRDRVLMKREALDKARAALGQVKAQYSEGTIPFLAVLKTQKDVDAAEDDVLKASSGQAALLIGLYKSLGVY